MSLTDTGIKSTKPKEEHYKLSYYNELCLLVHYNGSRYWRFRRPLTVRTPREL
ncbi:hypothetical protein GCM10009131_04860 [Morganella psychrotolerans]